MPYAALVEQLAKEEGEQVVTREARAERAQLTVYYMTDVIIEKQNLGPCATALNELFAQTEPTYGGKAGNKIQKRYVVSLYPKQVRA